MQRFLVVAAVFVAAAVVGFYVMARNLRTALGDRPFVAAITEQLRVLVAGQQAYHNEHRSYTTDVLRVWRSPADSTARGVRIRVIAADADGFIAEGLSDHWNGRCLVAVGRYTGDSLTKATPVCRSS